MRRALQGRDRRPLRCRSHAARHRHRRGRTSPPAARLEDHRRRSCVLLMLYGAYYLIVVGQPRCSSQPVDAARRRRSCAPNRSPRSASHAAPPRHRRPQRPRLRRRRSRRAVSRTAAGPRASDGRARRRAEAAASGRDRSMASRIAMRASSCACISATRILVQGPDGIVYINRTLNPGDTYQVPNTVGRHADDDECRRGGSRSRRSVDGLCGTGIGSGRRRSRSIRKRSWTAPTAGGSRQ